MKIFYTLLPLLLAFISFAQPTTNMPNGGGVNSITSCNQIILDNGGNGNYSQNQNSTLTICSGSPSQFISLNFTMFNTEVNDDFLYIYAGTTATGTPIATLTGSSISVTTYQIPASCVTLVFTSDNNVNLAGFQATVSCYSSSSCTDGIQNGTETGVDCGGCSGCPPCPPSLVPATVTASANIINLPCGGGNVNLTAVGNSTTPVLNSNFNAGNPGPGWSFSGSGMFTNPCGPSPSGTTHLWFGNSSAHPRVLTTNAMNLSCGGTICFDFKMAIQAGAGSCEGPDLPNEGVTLSYSIDCGATFQNIAYFHPNGTIIGANPGTTTPGINGATNFTNWNNYCFTLPAAAQSANTIIQWSQLATSGAPYDHWGIDEVNINANNCNPYYYDWAHVPGSPNPATNTVNVTTTTTYNVIYTNGINDTASASVTVNVAGPASSTVTTTPVDYCIAANSGSATITGSGTSNPPYTFAVVGPSGYSNIVSGNPSVVLNNLIVGNYTVTTSDLSGCTSTSTFTIVGGPFCCDVTIVPTNLACNPNDAPCNGSTQALPVNGAGPYTYQWYLGPNTTTPIVGQTNQIMGGLCSGTYTVQIADQSGCIDSATVTLTQPTPLTLTGSHTNLTCFSSANGSITVTAGGGNPTYIYSIGIVSNSTGVFTNLNQGTYTVTATDINGCSIDTLITLTQPPLLNFNIINVTDAFCGVNNGLINLSATGGVAPYTYALVSGTTNSTGVFNNLAPSSYTFIITDANGCTVTTYQIVVNGQSSLTINADSIAHETCFGSNSGYISVSVNGTFPLSAYSYTINGTPQVPANTNIFTNLSAGNYTIVATNPNGCADSVTVTINTPPLLTVAIAQTNVSCNSACNGIINPTISGGVPAYMYSLNGGVSFNNPPLNNLCAGTYQYVVMDANGCLANQTVVITQPTPINYTGTTSPGTCGISNGAFAIATVSGGSGTGYTFSFNGSLFTTTLTYTGLSAGFYYLVIQDGTGCLDSNVVLIQNVEAPLLVNSIVIPNLCYGQTLGSIIATATDTSTLVPNPPPYFFSLNGGSFSAGTGPLGASNTYSNLGNGLYITQVQDANGCIRIDTLTVTSPTDILLVESHVDLSCFNDSSGYINLFATGGVGPYTYSVGNGQPTNVFGFFGGLSAGTYTPQVTDSNGCVKILPNIVITEPPALVANPVVANPLCAATCDGTVSFTASGGTPGYTYSLNSGTSIFSNPNFTTVCAGTYSYLVQDSEGCTVSGSISLIDPPALAVSAVNIGATCSLPNGTITATGSGGTGAYIYSISNGPTQSAQMFTNLGAGSYLIDVYDANGCNAETTQTIGQTGSPAITYVSVNVTCNGANNGTATTNVSGGVTPYSYSLNGSPGQSSPNFTGLSPMTYVAIVTDDNGCSDTANFTITEPPALAINTPTVVNILCFGNTTGSITVNPTGGTPPYLYSFNGGTSFSGVNNIQSSPAGAYNLQVIDANNCLQTLVVNITQPPALAIDPLLVNASCFGVCDGSINLQTIGGTGAYNYNWTQNVAPSNSGIASNLCAGVYSAIITDANGCVLNSGNQTIAEPPIVLITSVLTDSVSCNGFSDGIITINSTNTTNYQITGPSGTVSNSTGIFTGLPAGNYSIIVSDISGCQTLSSTIIYEPNPILVSSSGSVVSCPNTPVIHSVFVQGGTQPYTYAWSNSNNTNTTTVVAVGPLTLTVDVTDVNGCTTAQSSVSHTVTPILQIDPIAPIYLCDGDSTIVTATATDGQPDPIFGYTFTWSHLSSAIDTNQAYVTANANPASYWIVVKDMCDDFDSTELLVYPYQAPTITLSGPVDGCAPQLETFTLTSSNPLSNCAWDFGDGTTGTGCGTVTHTYTTPGIYTVTLTYDAFTSCPFDTTFTTVLEIYQLPVFNSLSFTNPLCFGSADGTITMNGNLGTTPYNYQINGGTPQLSNIFNGLISGPYTATIIDVNGCNVDSNITLIDPPVLAFTSIAVTNILCFGNSTGSISVAVSGGTPGIQYSFNGGVSYGASATQTNLPAGVYHVFVQDANGCTIDSANVTITQPNELLVDLVSINDATCYDFCDGSIFVGYTGGTLPITYTWSANAATGNVATAINLCDGSYNILLTDGNGCTVDSIGILINEPPQIVVTSIVVDSITCFGAANGQIAITATNGNAYELSGPMPTVTNATGVFTGLIPGTYTVTIYDVNLCTIDTLINVYQPAVLAMTNSGDTTVCYAVPVTHTVTVTGGTLPYLINWDTGATGPSLTYTALQDTSLAVSVTDANGCAVAQQIINITVIPLLTINPIANQTICIGDSILTNATAQNGLAPYSFHWSNLPAGNNINPQYLFGTNNPTIYWVSVTDVCGDLDSTQVSVFNYTAPTFTLTGPADGCAPQNETFTIVGPTSPMSNCSWNFGNGQTAVGCGTQNITYANPGVYSVNLTYNAFAGCTFDTTFVNVLEIFANPVIDSVNFINPTCFGFTNGQVTIFASNGNTPYLYQLGAGPNQVSNNFTGLGAALYAYTVSDINNCVASSSVTLVNPPVLSISQVVVTNVICNGNANGTITVTATGGTLPYQYSFNGGVTYSASNIGSGLIAGNYNISVRDANLCVVDSFNIVVTQPTPLQVNSVNVVNASCFGFCNGSITVAGTGGTTPYSYSWSANASTGNSAIANNLCAGLYTATITDANGCFVDSVGITVAQPPQIVITSIVKDSVNCFGGSDGTATINALNAVNYAITGPVNLSQASNVFTGLPIGTYALQLTDVNGCTKDSSFQIFQPTPLVFSNIAIQPNLCNGDNTGGITITAAGGSGPYTYSFNSGTTYGASNANLTLTAGTYNLSILDVNGCTVDSIGVIVTQPTPVVINTIVVVNTLCNGSSNGSITVTASGGTMPYQYSFNGGTTYSSSNSATGLPAGNYNIIVRDANLCLEDSLNIVVDQPTPVLFSFVNLANASCFGFCDGAISIGATGGTSPYSYSWSANASTGNSANASALCAGTYTATITDANGCFVDSVGMSIAQPPQIIITSIVLDSVSCFGGSDGAATINAVNAVNYSITGPVNISQASNIFTGLPIGTYALQLTDINGCTKDSSFQIFQPTALTFANIVITTNLCNGDNTGGITITASGGIAPYTYSFNGGASYGSSNSNLTLAAGSYNLSILDANGCSVDSFGVIINQPAALATASVVINNVSCFGYCDGNITANVTGGTGAYTYVWSANANTTNTNTAINLCAGSYNVQVTDSNGCALTVNNNIVTQPGQVIFVNILTDSVNCFAGADGIIDITATNALTYSLNGGTPQASGLFTGLTAGFYTITIAGVNGCTATTDTTIYQPTPFTISTGNDTTVCINTNASLFGFGAGGSAPYNFQWNGLPAGPNPTVTTSVSTTYYLNATDANGCPAGPDSTRVIVHDLLTAAPLVGTTVCPGGSSLINANVLTGVPVYTYAWAPAPISGQGTATADLAVGTYNLLITDFCGATVNQPVTIGAYPEPTFAFTGITNGCAPHTVTIDPNNASIANCSWTLGDGSTANGCGAITHTYNTPGTYNLTFMYTSANGCVFDTTLTNAVTVSPTPIASFTFNPSTPSLTNNTVNFTNTSIGGSTYAWTFGASGVSSAQNPIYTFPSSVPADFNICLTVTDVYPGYTCASTYCDLISLDEEFTVYVPNAFTPDNNEHNNEFRAIVLGERTNSFEMQIYNRWGQLVFESRDHQVGWDGTYLGENCQDGTYIWKIRVKDKNVDDVKTFSGHVNLLR